MHKAVVLCEHNLRDWRLRYAAGDAPAALPYEVDSLERAGISVDAYGVWAGRIPTKARHVVEHRLGYSVQVPLAASAAVTRADVVLALLEREAILPSLFKRHKVPPYGRKPLVVWSVWLADDIRNADSDRRAEILRRFESADLITHMSPDERETFVDLGIPEERLFTFTYGVSHEYYRPGDGPRDIPVLAVGQDRGRDYATLFAGVDGTRLSVDVVCKPENLTGLAVPDNVRIHAPVGHRAYRALLQRAQVVAIPTRVMSYPTGSSVALEAAASGCVVAVTDTPAMRRYVTDETGLLVPPGDPLAWRAVLTMAHDDAAARERLGQAARESIVSTFNAQRTWRELADVMRARGIL